MLNAAIMLCAGQGTRMQGTVEDKILVPINGLPVICYSINVFLEAGIVQEFNFVYRDEAQKEKIAQALVHCDLASCKIHWTQGGGERQDSVFNAISELSLLVDYVFIHDCARPLLQPAVLIELQQTVVQDKAAVLARRVTDTIKQVSESKKRTRNRNLNDIPRSGLWAMETPQAFERELISDAYRRIRFDNVTITDDTAAASREGHTISLVENSYPNPKITVPLDITYIEFLLSKSAEAKD